jgi:hypothetical protein
VTLAVAKQSISAKWEDDSLWEGGFALFAAVLKLLCSVMSRQTDKETALEAACCLNCVRGGDHGGGKPSSCANKKDNHLQKSVESCPVDGS